MRTETLVRTALQEKNPALYRQLTETGQLESFLVERADQIRDESVTLTMQIANAQGMSKVTDPMKRAGIMRQARSMAHERVYAEMLEFPPDETSPQRPDETTASATQT